MTRLLRLTAVSGAVTLAWLLGVACGAGYELYDRLQREWANG